jgi:hypothetical protein
MALTLHSPRLLGADWAKTKITFRGAQFHSSLTPTAMRGIVDFQNSLYRSAAMILRGDARVRRLTAMGTGRLRAYFRGAGRQRVTEGDGKGFLELLAGAVSTMESSIADRSPNRRWNVFWHAGNGRLYGRPNSAEENAQGAQITMSLIAENSRALELLARSAQQSREAAVVRQQAEAGYEAVVRVLIGPRPSTCRV